MRTLLSCFISYIYNNMLVRQPLWDRDSSQEMCYFRDSPTYLWDSVQQALWDLQFLLYKPGQTVLYCQSDLIRQTSNMSLGNFFRPHYWWDMAFFFRGLKYGATAKWHLYKRAVYVTFYVTWSIVINSAIWGYWGIYEIVRYGATLLHHDQEPKTPVRYLQSPPNPQSRTSRTWGFFARFYSM